MTNDFITDPTWTGVNHLHVRALLNVEPHTNPDGYLRAVKTNLAQQLAASILSKSGHFTYSHRTEQTDFIQADAVVLTEDEYFNLCERMYRKGFERGRCA